MANLQRNFIRGRMNKSLEQRLLPNGEYTNAVNVRLGSTEQSEIGSVENSKGNTKLTQLAYINGTLLSDNARCIGAYEDSANETLYWFVHDPTFTLGATGKLDLIVSFNIQTGGIVYHVISIDNGTNVNTTLNFNPEFLITGINKIDNLLFFTDNTNPPRVINIETNYPNPLNNIDQFTARQIQVVKQPPLQAPTLQLIKISNERTFLTDNFICFGYRYRYENAEYSATSQFSEPAFEPSAYNFSAQSFENSGMENRYNGVIVSFNSGSSLVKGIDILYKEANDPTIQVIERINKSEVGMSNNTFYSFEFSNKKIFSVLPESEILRLYDNVPTKAKAQTLMANRLVYGNYIEGYDLKDTFNQPLTLSYITSLSTSGIALNTLTTSTNNSQTYTAFSQSQSINDSTAALNFSTLTTQLVVGATIDLSFTFEHDSFVGTNPPDTTTPSTTVSFSYTLIEDFTGSSTPIQDLIASSDFKSKFGTISSEIQTVANAQTGAGVTFTDQFNFVLPATLGTATVYDIYQTGILNTTSAPPSVGGPILATAPIGQDLLQLTLLSAQYQENGGTNLIVEYFKITSLEATIQEVNNTGSLHSNRGYEVGIIYMDTFNRASTALVSKNNTVNIPCSNSITKNEIIVTIPVTQRAPSWATRYKFCIKADRDTYDTIYSGIFLEDDNTDNVYFLLEGNNIGKVKDGDKLVIKRDSNGPLSTCTTATVLEVVQQEKDFITVTRAGVTIPIPPGVYMKMSAVTFSAIMQDDDVIDVKVEPVTEPATRKYPVLAYPFFQTDTSGTKTVYNFPVGTRVVMRIEQTRTQGGQGCEAKTNIIEHTFICRQTYADALAFFNGESVGNVIERNAQSSPADIENVYVANTSGPLPSTVNTGNTEAEVKTIFGSSSTPTSKNYYRLWYDTSSTPNVYYLLVSGTVGCAGRNGDSTVRVNFTVYRRDAVVVFETEPKPALPDLWYESAESFEIDSLGNHLGNELNQNIANNRAGVVKTDFSNCFTFGNGVESYKILDSSFGKQFNLGNRTFTTNNTTFQQAHRFADLTYSGVFNDETNVNKLNEFNLGLANFKPLEETFGDVEILYARRDDILVLQEDKISYVLAGKDLLSDASGDGQLTSVPQVLGKQIARIENYGISNHPESFSTWGESKFFTDAKRSAVINLVGSSAANEQLQVISEEGMRSWFRDLFTASFTTQKLGAYDPYMNEYVLTSNTILKPEVAKCTACGVTRDITVPADNPFIYCVDLEEQIGTVLVTYNIPLEGPQPIITEATSQNIITESGDNIETEGAIGVVGYTIRAIYNGVTTTTGVVYTSGSFTFNKDSTTANQVVLEITTTSTVDDTIEMTVACPSGTLLNLYSVCVTDTIDSGKFIHNEASWDDGALFSATQSNLVTLGSGTGAFVISQYNVVSGNQGVGLLPTDNSVMKAAYHKINFDNLNFNPNNNGFSYLKTNTTYADTIADISTLLGLSINMPLNSSSAPNYYSGSFTVPSGGNNLYLIYDYRGATTPTPPTPTPTPTVFDYYQYTQCGGGSTQIFRVASGTSAPAVVKYNNICYENPQSTSTTSNIDITETYLDCASCQADYKRYQACLNSSTTIIAKGTAGYSFPGFIKYNNVCYENPQTTTTTSNLDIAPIPTFTSCATCDASLYNFREYTQCGGGSTQVFKLLIGSSFQPVYRYNGVCYENPQTTSSTVGVDAANLSFFANCTLCSPEEYVYRRYAQCNNSNVVQVFRLPNEQGVVFPQVVKYNLNGVDTCFENPESTGSTSNVDVPSLVYDNCEDCEETLSPTPTPPTPTPPTPTPGGVIFRRYEQCNNSNVVQVFYQTSSTFPDIVRYNDICYELPEPTGSTTGVSLSNLATFTSCEICAGGEPPTPPSPTPTNLFYRLIHCTLNDSDCYYQSTFRPSSGQRFVDGTSGNNPQYYYYNGDAGVTSDQGIPCQNISLVEQESGCPPITPPTPPAPTPVTYQNIEIQECYTTSPRYFVRITNATSLQLGQAITIIGTGGTNPEFDTNKYWEIIDDNAPTYNSEAQVQEVRFNCSGFTPPPSPPTPPTPPTPAIVYAQYLICDGNDAVAYVSGPTGTTFPTVLKISGICYEYSTLGGATGADYTNYDSFASCSLCEGTTPTPPTPAPSPPTPTCFAINNISTGSSASLACNPFRFETMYFNNSSFCQASNFFRTDANCNTSVADTYVSNGSYSRQWSNGQFGPCLICEQQ